MKTPGFWEGVIVALIAAVTGEILITVLPWLVGRWLAVMLVVSLLSLGYLLYLLKRSPGKTGRMSLLLLWCLASFGAAVLDVGIPLYLIMQLGFIWLTRSFYFRSSVFGALADLGLHALAFSAGVWAYARSGSVFLTLWTFFLVEALFPLLPGSNTGSANTVSDESGVNPRFEQAHRTALAALQRLSSR